MASIGTFVDIFFIQNISFAWSSMRDPLAIKYPSILTDSVVTFPHRLPFAALRRAISAEVGFEPTSYWAAFYLKGSDNVCFHFCHGLVFT